MGREREAARLGHLEMRVCSDGRSRFHKTASRSPGSPLCPAERWSGRKRGTQNAEAHKEDKIACSDRRRAYLN